MIQELFAASNLIPGGERKISINSPSPSSILLPHTPPTTASSTVTTTTTTAPTSNSSENQNLRCPRCDSSNTKFCYYNNYNLTQPRHFCKTCRRYWTKGGALRNVPIGGGCRKNKNNIGVSTSVAKAATTATKMKAVVASELVRSGHVSILDHELQAQPTPILWGSPQNTHLLALLRASQNQNPNPNPISNPISMSIKEEGSLMGSNHSHMVSEPLIGNGLVNIPRTLGYDGVVVGHVPSLGLCSSLWRNNNNHHHHQDQDSGFVLGEDNQSSGIQDLYHKLRSTTTSNANNYSSDNNNSSSSSPIMFMGNMASNSSSSSSSSSLSTILESSSMIGGGEFGCWMNPTLPWSDLPTTTTNGAYP